MRISSWIAELAVGSSLIFTLLTPTHLPAHPPITTLLYSLEEPSSLASTLVHLDQISIIAPQVFVMDKEGFVLNIHVSYRHLYNLFVEEAARRFRQRGLKFSVAVVAKHTDQPEGYVESVWKNWAGVFDYATLGRAVDFLSIMTYDQHGPGTPPGPVAGLPWVTRVRLALRLDGMTRSRSPGSAIGPRGSPTRSGMKMCEAFRPSWHWWTPMDCKGFLHG